MKKWIISLSSLFFIWPKSSSCVEVRHAAFSFADVIILACSVYQSGEGGSFSQEPCLGSIQFRHLALAICLKVEVVSAVHQVYLLYLGIQILKLTHVVL